MAFKRLLSSFLILAMGFLTLYLLFDLTTFLLGLSTFFLVFLLGFQSLSVQSRKWLIAPVLSFGIGVCNLYMFMVVPHVDINNVQHVAAYLLGGPVGILYSMFIHFKVVGQRSKRSEHCDLEL